MPAFPSRRKPRTPYWLKFTFLLVSMGATTAAFVLVVLPRRFVLQAGLIESGVSFATSDLPFWPGERPPLMQPPVVSLAQPVALGHAQLFWSNVLPLLEEEHFDAAIPLFRQYLSDHPEDIDVWREYAVVLTRSGKLDEAESVYQRLLEEDRDSRDILAFARLLRERGQYERSLAFYRELASASPQDVDLHHELAQTLVWAELYREAADSYRTLLAAVPDDPAYRLELARVFYWDDRPVNAFILLADFPLDSPHAAAAADFRAFLDSLLLASLPVGQTMLERARRAVAEQDLAGAAILYRSALGRAPRDADPWTEWADFLQYHATDLAGARDAIVHVSTLRDLSDTEQFRLAQLHAWTGYEADAKELLIDLLSREPGNAEAWAMLGDLYQWQGSSLQAAAAYRRALVLAPGNEQAAAGIANLKYRTAELVSERESPGIGPELAYFRDSDDFERLELAARAHFLWSKATVAVRTGYRRVQGLQLDGNAGRDRGPFAEVEVGHWWRLGTVRTALTTGFESFEASGTEPTLAVRIDVPDLHGTAARASLSHGRAFSQAATYESVEANLLADFLELSAFRPVANVWSVTGGVGLATLHGSGSSNLRANAAATVRRELSAVVDAAVTTQFLLFSDSAPSQLGRRLYWDPSAFWSGGLQVGMHTIEEAPWRAHTRLSPGLALVKERDTAGLDLVPQIAGEGSVALDTRRVRFRTDVAYSRGREGAYSSFGVTSVLTIKF